MFKYLWENTYIKFDLNISIRTALAPRAEPQTQHLLLKENTIFLCLVRFIKTKYFLIKFTQYLPNGLCFYNLNDLKRFGNNKNIQGVSEVRNSLLIDLLLEITKKI